MSVVEQIVCPECAASDGIEQRNDSHRCLYCGTTFNIVRALSDEENLQAAIQKWFRESFGQSAGQSQNIDSVGRSLLFNRQIYPELERDVDNALTDLGFLNPAGVARLPVPTKQAASNNGLLLLHQHAKLPALSLLRRRLGSEQVRSFAVDEATNVRLRRLERRIGQAIWLTNAAHACQAVDTNGYRSAGANFRALAQEIDAAVTDAERTSAADEADWFRKLKQYLSLQARVLRLCESLLQDEAVEGREEIEDLEQLRSELASLADEVEKAAFDPGLAVSFAMALKHERENIGVLQRWLRAYIELSRGRNISFQRFARQMDADFAAAVTDPLQKIELIESASQFTAYLTHGRTTMVIDTFEWTKPWAESRRERGFFGGGEQVEAVETYFIPVWLAEVKCSRATGRFLKSGQQDVVHAMLNAAILQSDNVQIIGGKEDPFNLSEQLRAIRPLPHQRVAFPRLSAGAAQKAFERFFHGHSEILNARPTVHSLAFVPAARATLTSKKGRRVVHDCLNGALAADDATFASQQLTQRLCQPSTGT